MSEPYVPDWATFKRNNFEPYISFRQYVTNVMKDQPRRKDDLEDLCRAFGAPVVERVFAGEYVDWRILFGAKVN